MSERKAFIKIDQDSCIGCGACISACPEEALKFNNEGKSELIIPYLCAGHGQCIDVCPVQAIQWNK
ncbi:NAD(P)-binding_domain-containing protein [Hexamita inflata]|uniref:NAD(P)-binding domain-containing protein n=1 Tax=Hexamita inflata TaxID=28002 RepID=A0AA86NVF7_9EUKA|nr:NAD(P)-binding domain-containing protein [Hexamita inflata]